MTEATESLRLPRGTDKKFIRPCVGQVYRLLFNWLNSCKMSFGQGFRVQLVSSDLV
jgi:hypothetical protein